MYGYLASFLLLKDQKETGKMQIKSNQPPTPKLLAGILAMYLAELIKKEKRKKRKTREKRRKEREREREREKEGGARTVEGPLLHCC